MDSANLRSITSLTKDGEWGKGEPFESSVEMAVVRGTDFEAARVGVLDGIPLRHIPEHIAARKRVQAFDILIETAGGSKDRPTGRTLLVKPSLISKSALPLTCASFARFIRIDRRKALPEYVFWLLQYLYHNGTLHKYHTQHTGVARFQFTTFSEREALPLPSVPIQQRIASILSAYDDLIENNTRRIKILEEMAQMLYREWFVNFRFPGHEEVRMVESELGPIPEDWSLGTISDLLTLKSGYAFKSSTFSNDGEFCLVTIRNVQDGFFSTECQTRIQEPPPNLPKFCILKPGDILMSLTGNIGRTCLVYGKNLFLNQRVAKVLPNSDYDLPFVYCFLRHPLTQARLAQISTGVAQQNLSPVKASQERVMIPSIKVRNRFCELANPEVAAIVNLYTRNANLRTTRGLLLPKLISGEIPVEAADEIMEATA